MLFFSRWKAISVLLTAVVICLFAVPNFFPDRMVQRWPAWAQRHIVLGLDLQGGSHLLLEVDSNAVRKEKVQASLDDVRRVLREARIGYTGLVARGDSVEVRIREGADPQVALAKLRELSQPIGGVLGGGSQRTVDVADLGGGLIRLTLTQAAITERIRQSVDQSIQIVERRVNELGTVEPTIQREGIDRILVQVPGLQDPTRLKDILGKTAKLTFRLVDMSMSPEQALQGQPPPDSEILKDHNQVPYVIQKRVMVSGEELTDAQPGFDQRTSEPIVTFRFNSAGARRFAQVTQENVGRPFAIVLDNEVISAPVIREPILGGSGQISGSFTVEAANDLAILLRAGAADDHRGAHGRPRPRPGFDPEGQDRRSRGFRTGRGLHVGDLRPVRVFRQCRRRRERRHDLRLALAPQCHAHASRHCRHRAHGWHRGGQQRADLRENPRRGPQRPLGYFRDRCRIHPGARHHPRL
jgi:preprotein translocase subunit SecD